jgi:transposase
MPRPRKYNTPEEAREAKLAQAREKYRLSRVGVERKKWGFINTVITADMVGKTIKELELEYKANHPPKTKVQQVVEEEDQHDEEQNEKQDDKQEEEEM